MNLSYEAVCPNVGNNSCHIQSSLLSTTRWREQGEEDVGPQRRGLNRWQSFPLVLDPLLRPHRHPPNPLSLLGHDLRVLGYVLLALLLQTKISLGWNVKCLLYSETLKIVWWLKIRLNECDITVELNPHKKDVKFVIDTKFPFQTRPILLADHEEQE